MRLPWRPQNENSDNGNQKAASEYGVSFKQKSPTIILLFNLSLASHCYRSVEPIYTLDCNTSGCT